jgi:hypothetical protein
MTKLSKLHQAWLKNPDYKHAYKSMQVEFEIERQGLSTTSASSKSERPIQLHDSQIQTRRSSNPH